MEEDEGCRARLTRRERAKALGSAHISWGGGLGARPERAAHAAVGRYSGGRGVQPRCATPKGLGGGARPFVSQSDAVVREMDGSVSLPANENHAPV